MTTQKVFSSRALNVDASTYVGEAGRLFYDQPTGTGTAPVLKYSDGITPGGLAIGAGSGGTGTSVAFTVTDISYFTNDVGYLTSATVNTYITPSDRISSGTSQLVVTADNTVTFPTLTTMSDTTASVVFNMADATVLDLPAYSTTSTDEIAIGTYGNTATISAPYVVTRFAVAPAIELQTGDIISGPGYPVPSPIEFVGTGSFSSIVITHTDLTDIAPLAYPQPGEEVTLARPMQTMAFDIRSPADTSILINPGAGGNIILNNDLIPLNDNVQSLGSVLNRWRHIWVAGGSIFIKDLTKNSDVSITAQDNLLKVVGSSGLKVGEFTLQDNQITIKSNDRDIIVGSTTATGYVQFNRPVRMVNSANTTTFEITRDGLVTIFPKQDISITESALSIVGNAAGLQQPRNFTGTMLQITGQNGISSRVSIDSFGTNAYPLIAGRAARGTVQTPTAIKANDLLFRISTQGYGDNQYVPSIGRISIEAAENFTNATAGTRINFQLTPTGTNVIQTSTIIDSRGIDFDGNATGGITFYDRTRQTTAFTGTIAASNITNFNTVGVTSISIGTGLSGSGGPGVASLNNEGVLSVAGTTNQIKVNGSYTTASNGNVTLGLPQDIAPDSNVTFNDVTINGNLNFLGTATVLIPSTVDGTILYLGFTATTTSTIDGGGIQLGNTATGIQSIFWRRNGNYWDFDGSGISTQALNATTSTLGNLIVTDGAHFGASNIGTNYDNAIVQVDDNRNIYSQVIIQNHSSGTSASSNFVAANNLNTGTYKYSVTFGKLSSNFAAVPIAPYLEPNDGYLINEAGNLYIANSLGAIKFNIGIPLAATIDSQGLTVVNTATAAKFVGPLTGNVTGDVTGNVSGNAGSVTNGVYSNQTYNNPTWLATLAGSKITGYVASATTVVNGIYSTDTGTVTNNMLAGGITNNKLSSSTITLNVSNGITVSQPSPSLGGSTTIGFNTATLVATAVTATSAAYAYSFNTGTLVTNAVNATNATNAQTAVTATNVINAVTRLTAGAGISVSTSTGSVTVTNTGVTSITAGTGTAISTSTGAVTVWNTVVGSIYGSGNVRTMGSTQTVSIDYNTDSFIHIDNPPGTVTIAFSNYVAGRAVKVIISNNTKQTINLGVLAGNSSIGATALAGNLQATGQAVIIDYISLDGTSNLNFAAVSWK